MFLFPCRYSAWYARQSTDEYVRLAKEKGYRCRSAFKLLQIHEKFKILRKGISVIDIGCSPGSWLQVCSQYTKNIVGIDLSETEIVDDAVILKGDFCSPEIQSKLDMKFDGILSDMAPSATGDGFTDHVRSMNLSHEVLKFSTSKQTPNPEAFLVCKYFKGQYESDLIGAAKKIFENVRIWKPPACRKESSEIYLIAKGKI